MKALANLFLSIAISSLGSAAVAGSRDAYFVLVVDLDAGRSIIAKRLVEDYFHGRYPDNLYDCAVNNGGKFELSYLRVRPKAITNSLINGSLAGSLRDLAKIQKSLRNFRDNELRDGFDFLLAYRISSNALELSAISAGLGQRTVQRNVQIDPDPKSLQAQMAVAGAICELSGVMPFIVAP